MMLTYKIKTQNKSGHFSRIKSEIKSGRHRGFMAVTAVILLAAGTLAFSLTTMSAAVSFADRVARRELRLQAGLNASSCLATLRLMAAKDHFLNGELTIRELGCTARIENNLQGSFTFEVEARLEGVVARHSGSFEK